MIYITGDTHIPIDIHKLSTSYFPEQKEMTKKDYLIVTGDFGLIWGYKETGRFVPGNDVDNHWNNEELFWYKWLNDKPFTTLWVDGNHENYNRLKTYKVEEWHGGKVQKISDSIIHLMRGQVYEIDGLKVFTMGGARSHDRGVNTHTEDIDINKWWWPDEMPTQEEFDEGDRNLAKHNNKVDLIISHDAPGNIVMDMHFAGNELTNYFWDKYENVEFKKWFCGHYHKDTEYGRVRILYYDILNVEEELKKYA